MPNYFTLTKIGAEEPSTFSAIDDELCAHLDIQPDPEKYYLGWYDSIGLGLAMDKDWDELRSWWEETSRMQKVIDYLEKNYLANAWYQHK